MNTGNPEIAAEEPGQGVEPAAPAAQERLYEEIIFPPRDAILDFRAPEVIEIELLINQHFQGADRQELDSPVLPSVGLEQSALTGVDPDLQIASSVALEPEDVLNTSMFPAREAELPQFVPSVREEGVAFSQFGEDALNS